MLFSVCLELAVVGVQHGGFKPHQSLSLQDGAYIVIHRPLIY